MNKYLYLTTVKSELTEAAEKRLDELDEEYEPTCSNGRTREWYEDMNIKIPQDLLDKEKSINKGVDLTDEDFNYTLTDSLVNLKDFVLAVDNGESCEDGAVVYIRNKMTYNVVECSAEITRK